MGGQRRADSSRGGLVEEVLLNAQESAIRERKLFWRRLRHKVLGTIVAGAVLTAAGVQLAHLFTAANLERSVQTASQSLGSDAGLEAIASRMEQNLDQLADHGPSQRLLMRVRMRQAVEGRLDAAEAREMLAAPLGQAAFSEPLRAAWTAILNGDPVPASACATGNLSQDEEAEEAAVEAQAAAFLCGWSALVQPLDTALVQTALARLEAVRDAEQVWEGNIRLLAALSFRTGDVRGALAKLEAAKPDRWTWSLAVDDALYRGLLHEDAAAVVKTVEAALNPDHELSPRTRALALLAHSAALLHRGEKAEARAARREAWSLLPVGDFHGRELAFELALQAGEFEEATAWIDAMDDGDPRRSLYQAWLRHARGDQKLALEGLAKLPQDAPSVARLQALALVEQSRFDEAKHWVEYATARAGHRLDLRVAALRLPAGELKQRKADLQALAEEHPHAPRVWTALGLIHLASESKPDTVESALRRAVEQEPVAAEAALALAQLIERGLEKKPERVLEARDLYAKAAEWLPEHTRYSWEYGAFLGRLGLDSEALKVLEPLLDKSDISAPVWLEAARVQARLDRTSNGLARARAWIAKSKGSPQQVALAEAQIDLIEGTPAALAHAVGVLSPVLGADRSFTPHRVALAEALRRQGKVDEARDTLLTASRLDSNDGRIALGMADVERARGNDRSAAGYAFRGWRRLISDGAAPSELLAVAPRITDLWIDIKQEHGARAVGRDLTKRVPYLAESWIVRGQGEFAADDADGVCRTAEEAKKLAPKHPEVVALTADCHVKRREFAAARKVYREALDGASKPQSDSIRRRLNRVM